MSRPAGGFARWTLAVLLFVGAIGAASARVGPLRENGGVRLSADWVMTDFYSAAYHPARAVLEGATPYTRDTTYPPYAPLHLLIHLPFALLEPLPAGVAYFLFTILLTLPLAWLALRLANVEPRGHRIVMLAGALLLSRPGHWTLLLGQVSILLTVATYVAFATARTHPHLGGAALAVALLKPTYGVPLALLLGVWGGGRAAAWGLGLAAMANLPLLALFAVREGGTGQLLDAMAGGYRSWQEIADVNPATSNTRTDAISLVSRFLGEPLSDPGQVLLSVGLLVLSAAVLRSLAHHAARPAHEAALAIICLAISLVGFHRGYDLVLLCAPFVAAAAHIPPPGHPRVLRLALLMLFAVPALNWIATESVLAALQPSRPTWLVIVSANALSLLALLLVYLWLAARCGVPASHRSDEDRRWASAGSSNPPTPIPPT